MEHPDFREKLLKKKDLGYIVKVSDDTLYIAEIIPIFGRILPKIGMFHMLFLVLSHMFKTIVHYVVKNISIIIVVYLCYQPILENRS